MQPMFTAAAFRAKFQAYGGSPCCPQSKAAHSAQLAHSAGACLTLPIEVPRDSNSGWPQSCPAALWGGFLSRPSLYCSSQFLLWPDNSIWNDVVHFHHLADQQRRNSHAKAIPCRCCSHASQDSAYSMFQHAALVCQAGVDAPISKCRKRACCLAAATLSQAPEAQGAAAQSLVSMRNRVLLPISDSTCRCGAADPGKVACWQLPQRLEEAAEEARPKMLRGERGARTAQAGHARWTSACRRSAGQGPSPAFKRVRAVWGLQHQHYRHHCHHHHHLTGAVRRVLYAATCQGRAGTVRG